MINGRGNPKPPVPLFVTMNLTWSAMELDPSLHGIRPAKEHMGRPYLHSVLVTCFGTKAPSTGFFSYVTTAGSRTKATEFNT
jgi:hypothetical protein